MKGKKSKEIESSAFVRQLARQRELRNEERSRPRETRFAWSAPLVEPAKPKRQDFNRVAPLPPVSSNGTKAPLSLGREAARERIEAQRIANRDVAVKPRKDMKK